MRRSGSNDERLKRLPLWLTVMLAFGGCGGGDGASTNLVRKAAVQTGAGTCGFVDGPFAVGAGTMTFTVDDAPTDTLEIAIFPDSVAADVTCDFAAQGPVINETLMGSGAGSVTVAAGSYDLFDICYDPTTACSFNLTWSGPVGR